MWVILLNSISDFQECKNKKTEINCTLITETSNKNDYPQHGFLSNWDFCLSLYSQYYWSGWFLLIWFLLQIFQFYQICVIQNLLESKKMFKKEKDLLLPWTLTQTFLCINKWCLGARGGWESDSINGRTKQYYHIKLKQQNAEIMFNWNKQILKNGCGPSSTSKICDGTELPMLKLRLTSQNSCQSKRDSAFALILQSSCVQASQGWFTAPFIPRETELAVLEKSPWYKYVLNVNNQAPFSIKVRDSNHNLDILYLHIIIIWRIMTTVELNNNKE